MSQINDDRDDDDDMMKLLERMYQTLYNSAHQQQVISVGHSQKLITVAILFSLGWQPFRKPVNFV